MTRRRHTAADSRFVTLESIVEIGFVSPRPLACPIYHNSFPHKGLSFVSPLSKLALFRTLAVGGIGRLAVHPRKIGFVCTSGPAGDTPAILAPRHCCPGANWLCFARLSPAPAPGSRGHVQPLRDELALFVRASAAADGPVRQRDGVPGLGLFRTIGPRPPLTSDISLSTSHFELYTSHFTLHA